MEEETLKQQWIKLNSVRAWIANRLCNGSDITDNAMFEAQQAIGFAMLHIEKAEYLFHRPAANSSVMSNNPEERQWPA
ncbi:hypothetical protein QUB40_26350 [Microcoleus sp. AT9_A2]|uniref:hypothetical protein n=1 Tax=Microcoleus sp. AT9_A2 TaxID=2818624 RepID=UPI002FD3BAA6